MIPSLRSRLPVLAASVLLTMASADLSGSPAGSGGYPNSLNDALQGRDVRSSEVAESGSWMVQLEEAPVARYKGGLSGYAATSRVATGDQRFNPRSPAAQSYQSYLVSRQDQVLADISSILGRGVAPERRWQYAVNGFAIEMDREAAREIAELPGVRQVTRERERIPLTFAGPDYVGATDIWNGDTPSGIGTKGEDTVVAIFDSGLNWDHVSFAAVSPGDGYTHTNPLGDGVFAGLCDDSEGDFNPDAACNNKLIGIYDMVGGDGADANGHGTHVASTAAGNELTTPDGISLSGVAPRANIISYRVCGDAGCPSGVDAAEHVLANHASLVDAVNYSIGPTAGGGDPYEELTAQAFLSLNEAGILVSAAGGNSGPGAETISNFGPWNLTVASNHHGGTFQTLFSVTGPGTVPGDLEDINPIPSAGLNVDTAFSGELVDADAVDSGNYQACDPLPADSMDGKIGVAEIGGCNFDAKAINMEAAGAIGAVYYSGGDYGDHGIGTMGGDFPIPAIWVDFPVSLDLIDWVGTETTPTGQFHETALGTSGQHVMAGSSSRGPGNPPYAELPGPDVVASGASIMAAWIGGSDEFTTIGGTSMASPHVAGGVALMRSIHPAWSATEIQSAIMMSANPDPVLKQDGATPATVYDRGNGLLTLGAAANAGLVLDESRANFDDANPDGGSLELYELNIPFLSNADCASGCSWTRTFKAVADGDWDVSASGDGFDVNVSPSSFSLLEGENQAVTVTVSNTTGDFEWRQGELVLTETSGAGLSDARLPILLDAGNPPPTVGDTLDLNGLPVPGGSGSALELEIDPDAGYVHGISWDLTYSTNPGAWLEEFRMQIVDPDGNVVHSGGAAGAIGADSDEVLDHEFGWASTGGTDNDTRTISDFDGRDSDGMWTVRFWNTYGSDTMGTLVSGSSLTFETESAVVEPTFDPEGGYFETGSDVDVTIVSPVDGASINYTMDDGVALDRNTGTSIASGDTVTVSDTATLRAIAFDPGAPTSDDSEITSADFTFYDPIAVEDGEGNPVTGADLASGEAVTFVPGGGSGSYDVDAGSNTVSGIDGDLTESGGSYTFSVPSEGAFAGTYTVTVTDSETGWTESFDVTVDLEMDSEYEELVAHGDRTEVRIRGAVSGYGFTFQVEDGTGADGSSLATMAPEAVTTEDDGPNANPGRSELVTLAVTEVSDVQVRATPEDGTYGETVLSGFTVDTGRAYSGWIRNELGQELEGVTIMSGDIGPDERPFSAQTGSDGVFLVGTPVPSGSDEHVFSATKDGYVSGSFSGDGCVGDTPQCEQVLESASATITGSVLGLGDGEAVSLYLVYGSGDDELELGPDEVTGAGEGDDPYQLDANYQAEYAEIRLRGFGYESASTDHDGSPFSFETEDEEIGGVNLTAVPTTPAVGDLTVGDVSSESVALVAEVSVNERASVATLTYGTSSDNLDSSLDDVSLAADSGTSEVTFEMQELACEAEVFFQVTAINDRDMEAASDIQSVSTGSCGGTTPPGNGGGDSGCTIGGDRVKLDPLMPMLVLLAMMGLIARRRV